MLREFQDEIRALRAQLEATQRGVMIGDDGKVRRALRCVNLLRAVVHSLWPALGVSDCRRAT
jgi:hypothetical protein